MTVALQTVAENRPAGRTAGGTVRVRPVIAGAQVTPPDAAVELGPEASPATFLVTPVARGKLCDARVEVYQNDKLVQELPLAMKGTRQTLAWVFLCLALLVPVMIQYLFLEHDWTRDRAEQKRWAQLAAAEAKQKMPKTETEKAQQKVQEKQMQVHGPGGGQMPHPDMGPGGDATNANLKTNALMDISAGVEHNVFTAIPDWVPTAVSKNVAVAMQDVYDWTRERAVSVGELPFYAGSSVLVLALGSWLAHLAYRTRRRGKPITLAA
jgi:hypothetical protein